MAPTDPTTCSRSVSEDVDTQCFLSWRDGDARSGTRLVRLYDPVLRRYFARRFAGDVGDLVQRTWLALLEARARFRAECDFRSFCLATARNIGFEEIRRRGRGTPFPESRLLPTASPDPLTELERREDVGRVRASLKVLSPGLLRVLELSYWDDCAGPRVAELLEIPNNTVRSRLRRARFHLRDELAAGELGAR